MKSIKARKIYQLTLHFVNIAYLIVILFLSFESSNLSRNLKISLDVCNFLAGEIFSCFHIMKNKSGLFAGGYWVVDFVFIEMCYCFSEYHNTQTIILIFIAFIWNSFNLLIWKWGSYYLSYINKHVSRLFSERKTVSMYEVEITVPFKRSSSMVQDGEPIDFEKLY